MNKKLNVKMQSDILIQIAGFGRKSANVSKTKWVCHLICMFFGFSLGKV